MSHGTSPPIDPERWRRLSALLDEALDLEDGERAVWLGRLHARDAALAAEAAALLSRHDALRREQFLDPPTRPAPATPTLTGMVVGAYTLRSPLGQGGMGSVWLADRSDGRFAGQAAVKLLNFSLIGRDGEARFRREANILARLRHPHIARLIDAGVSSLGQPYIVLENVEGERIDRYCDTRGLGVPERLRLFLEVLEAVAHAHANLIVHRDLKPQNVLVDSGGRARLLDFGIARLVEPQPGEPATVTREGEAALTPEYAAPEQVTGGHVTTAADVYGLGVLLCVLLTGRHPSGLSAGTPAEWVRVAADVEPQPMSRLAAGSGRARLAAALAGDLDNIAGRALRKNPAERYPSVEAFADDLRRHLRHEPVSARPDTLTYRTARFVRRHPAGVTAAAAAFAGTVMFTAGIAWQAREAARQRDDARAQMARATAAGEFMGFLLSTATAPGSKLTSGDLLERGEALIDKEYAGSDPLRAEMLVAIGKQYMGSEHFEKAAPVLERAADLAGRSGDPALLARALCPLALLRAAYGRADEAEALMKRAFDALSDDSSRALPRAECLIARASFGFFTNEAEAMKRDGAAALAILDGMPTPPVSTRIDAQGALAYGHYLARESREADSIYAALMEDMERAGRDRTLLAADTCNNWALVHYQGNISKAEPLSRRAVELRRAIEGAGAVAPSVTFNYAGILLQLARFDEAAPLYEETIRTARARRETLLETDAMLERVDFYLENGDPASAAKQLAAAESRMTDTRLRTARQAHLNYFRGHLALARGDAAGARARFTSAVEDFEKEQAKVSLFVFALLGLARSHLALGDTPAAIATAGRAGEVAASFVEPGTPSYLIGLSQAVLAEARAAAGDPEGANAAGRSAVEHLKITLGEAHPATVAALRRLSAPGLR